MSSPSEDKKDIELEEREKKMNEENKAHDNISNAADEPDEAAEPCGKLKVDNIKEVKPKKIPTGGILMPGFFTRSKSKEKCKEDGEEQEENTELVDKPKEESLMSQARIKLPNPFRKSKNMNEEDGEKSGEHKHKSLLSGGLNFAFLKVFHKRKNEPEQGMETKAGLASMETLDDNEKSMENKNDEMKTIPLNEKDVEKQAEQQEEATWKQKLKTYRLAISGFLVFVLLIIIIVACTIPSGPRYEALIKDGKYVTTVTACGKVEGILDDGGVAFRGIPYARPPIDNLRFQRAQPLDRLEYCWNGTLLTHNATDVCMQIYGNGTIDGVEDCLTLDVVTPYVRYDSPLPVIVLIGADSLMGGSPGKMRPSARYARARDVIFVRPNFRLGVLGFLALEKLSKDAYPHTSGNYGLSDIIVALQWVQYNIQHFGGDPTKVTLFGHKAGATLVTALTTIKNSNKLFARAWATSGGALYPQHELQQSEVENESYLKLVNCEDVECLRSKDAEYLVKATPDTWRKVQPDLPNKDEVPEKRHEWLVLDGKILQEHPATIWANEQGLPVKLVLGTTAHAASSDKLLNKHSEWTKDLVSYHVRNSMLGKLNLSEEAIVKYNTTYRDLIKMISDIRTVCPLLAIRSQMHNASFYVVTQERGPQNISDADSDIDAIFGRYEPITPEQRRYVSTIQQLFYHYIWHGKVASESPSTEVLVVEQDILPAHNYSRCDFWINKDVVLKYAQLD